jgi:mono/diheme cytochrome c family protein
MILRMPRHLVPCLTLLLAIGAADAAVSEPAPKPPEPATVQDTKREPPVALPRGQLLYENHCQGCHASIAHVRDNRRATTRTALRGWIVRWSGELKLGWGEAEVDDVMDYLNRRYYRLPPAN